MKRMIPWIACLALALPGTILAQDIERIEPPHWWQGFKETGLQLMVHGPNVSALEASVDAPGIRVERHERTANPNYLFVYLDIDPAAPSGRFTIRFEGNGVQLRQPYELRQKNPDPGHARGFTTADTIYLITPDRFANGNPANDNQPGMGDAVDRTELCGRHGGDIEGIARHLDYITDLGFTAIWLNPVLENRMERCSYHGYSTTDFYRVDPRYGSNEEYQALARMARERGVDMIMDMIVNHIGSGHWWMDDLPDTDWLNRPEKRTITNHKHVTLQDPYVSQHDLAGFVDGWFVDTMPDLNQRHPLLADYLTQNALWWIETLGLAGIRMDTHPYPDKDYMAEWSRRVIEEYPDFNMVGEEWHTSPVIVSYWQRGKQNQDGFVSHMPSMMDFPLQDTLARSLVAPKPEWNSSWDPVHELLALDSVYPDPTALVIFPDNHDMDRIFTQLEEDYDLWRMAMVFYATMRGTPQIYYGTEILMANRASGDHGLIRSDFPGGWPGDAKDAFTGANLGPDERRAQEFTRRLLQWRKETPVVHDGRLMQFIPEGESWVYFRYDDRDTVMVAFNKADEAVSLDLERFAERLHGHGSATDVLTGEPVPLGRELELPPRSVRLLELQPH